MPRIGPSRLVSQNHFNDVVAKVAERREKLRKHVWPSIVPMLTRLTLDLDSSLVNLPMPAQSAPPAPPARSGKVFHACRKDTLVRQFADGSAETSATCCPFHVERAVEPGISALPL